MTRRVNIGRAVVVPWQVPDLDTTAAGQAAREFDAAEGASPAADACDPAATGAGAARGAPSQASSDALVPEAVAAAMQRGHADGFAAGRREGYDHGYAEGLAAGQRDAEQHLVAELRLVDSMVRRLAEPTRVLERRVEEAVIALALEVARWVIGTEASRSADYLVRLIREAVAQVPLDVGTPAIVLNPIDIELVRGLAPDLEDNGIPLVGDDSVEPGGCLVIADGAEGTVMKDRRWHPRAHQGICEVDLTLASRWRNAMLAMFEGEEA